MVASPTSPPSLVLIRALPLIHPPSHVHVHVCVISQSRIGQSKTAFEREKKVGPAFGKVRRWGKNEKRAYVIRLRCPELGYRTVVIPI